MQHRMARFFVHGLVPPQGEIFVLTPDSMLVYLRKSAYPQLKILFFHIMAITALEVYRSKGLIRPYQSTTIGCLTHGVAPCQ